MNLTSEAIDAYKQVMHHPERFGLDFKSLSEIFMETSRATPKHVLYQQYVDCIGKPIPKFMFYVIMDETYGHLIDETADKPDQPGYKLMINPKS
ncbi:hypothetical protein [Pedobacter sp. L105]|uniref:hypothetical protein n=1 Tax=Pedobacter sp. L105 TaxID=1641871 RepID=UPI00131D9DE3|nr:hypothetical protein [Pedobacter sp. L105]